MKNELDLQTPIMNAAGMLGFAPNPRGNIDLKQLGAFVTNPVSLTPRRPAERRGLIPFSGGFLLHTGWPNPGLRSVIRQAAARWADCDIPVIVHLLAETADEVQQMVSRLENFDGVWGIELGLPPEIDPPAMRRMLNAALGELPVIACLPFEQATALAETVDFSQVHAISLAAPRGMLTDSSGAMVEGRMYGPALLPTTLAIVHRLAKLGLPVIGSGGIYTKASVDLMLQAGAVAVQLDGVLWRSGRI